MTRARTRPRTLRLISTRFSVRCGEDAGSSSVGSGARSSGALDTSALIRTPVSSTRIREYGEDVQLYGRLTRARGRLSAGAGGRHGPLGRDEVRRSRLGRDGVALVGEADGATDEQAQRYGDSHPGSEGDQQPAHGTFLGGRWTDPSVRRRQNVLNPRAGSVAVMMHL